LAASDKLFKMILGPAVVLHGSGIGDAPFKSGFPWQHCTPWLCDGSKYKQMLGLRHF
jgi:hypothetical protein